MRSACCDASIIYSDICSDCKEHCDVYCEDCGTEYPNGTESCRKCAAELAAKKYMEVRELLGLADKE